MLSQEQSTDLACDRAWVEINLAALAHNVQQLKSLLSPGTQLLAVVKADAYGHGAVRVAQTALNQGASWLGVATISEGIELRQAGLKAPILILSATQTLEEIQAIVDWQLQPTLCCPQQALNFSEALEQPLAVHIKIDTGMSRLGVPWQQGLELVKLVHRLPQLEIASLYSHLATADDLDPTFMAQQRQRFERVIAQIQAAGIPLPPLHLANSAATLKGADYHYDWVRVGLALYGLYPAPHFQQVDLKPVMQVKARVTQIKLIPPGTGVSYGQTFLAQQPTRLAVVGIGYADGVSRILSNQISVLVRGQPLPQIGTITMDQLMIDGSEIPDLQVGEVVTLIGHQGSAQISADHWAKTAGTISWEILTGFRHRLPRVVIEAG